MASRAIRVQALGLLLSALCCGCSIVGLGYRADHSRGAGRAEAARLSQLAAMYERQGHPAGAMRLYRQALHADPRSQDARERLMALSTQHATLPQPQPGVAPTPAAAAAAPTMLAQNSALPPAAVAAPRPLAAATHSSPALAPEPPTLPIRTAATTPQPTVPPPASAAATQPSSVVGDSASAVAMAAAPILALMAPPAGESPLASEHRAAQQETPGEVPLPESVAVAVVEEPARLEVPTQPQIQLVPATLPEIAEIAPAPLRVSAPQPRYTESMASVAIVTLPPLPSRPDESPVPANAGWTTNGSVAADNAPVRLPVENSGIVIRPQTAADEAPGRAQLTASTWSRTDRVRLCAGAPENLVAIVRRLESNDATVRKDALIELADLADAAKPVEAAVRSLFEDSNAGVRAHAAWAACRISGVSHECIDVLASVVQSDDTAGATFAAYCLGLCEAEAATAVPALQTGCLSEAPTVRLCAAEALLKITPDAPEPVATLIGGLLESAPEHRWLAAMSLSAASSDYQAPAIQALIPILRDADADVCSSAALALGAFGTAAAAAAPELEAALSHPDIDVRDSAAAALECIRN